MERKMCEGCVYWKRLSSSGAVGIRACHYLLMEGKPRRKDENGKCLEFQKNFQKPIAIPGVGVVS